MDHELTEEREHRGVANSNFSQDLESVAGGRLGKGDLRSPADLRFLIRVHLGTDLPPPLVVSRQPLPATPLRLVEFADLVESAIQKHRSAFAFSVADKIRFEFHFLGECRRSH